MSVFLSTAPGLGFEPKSPGPEPGVLPLDDPGTVERNVSQCLD